NTPDEECDSAADGACPGLCQPDCTCAPPTCGDNLVNLSFEQCDGRDDGSCPGRCRPDCTCAPLPPTGVVEADAYVSSGSHASTFGTKVAPNPRGASPPQQTFFRVRVSALGAAPPSSARLRLTVSSVTNAQSVTGGRLHPITNCSWNERTVTWDTRPAID